MRAVTLLFALPALTTGSGSATGTARSCFTTRPVGPIRY